MLRNLSALFINVTQRSSGWRNSWLRSTIIVISGNENYFYYVQLGWQFQSKLNRILVCLYDIDLKSSQQIFIEALLPLYILLKTFNSPLGERRGSCTRFQDFGKDWALVQAMTDTPLALFSSPWYFWLVTSQTLRAKNNKGSSRTLLSSLHFTS